MAVGTHPDEDGSAQPPEVLAVARTILYNRATSSTARDLRPLWQD
ncbi:MAG TPA: hypothetical protein VIY90_23510 [Steroidobacteraceae bacterium]